MNVNGASLIGGSDYEIRIRRSLVDGSVIATLDNISHLEYIPTVNGVGFWNIGLIDFDFKLLAANRIIDIYRKPPGGRLALDFRGILLNINPQDDMNNNPVDTISGLHINHLLEWRTVGFDEGTDEAQVSTLEADDAMKKVMDENYGPSAVSGRQFDSANLSIATDTTLAQQITQSFSRQPVLQVLQAFADDSRDKGTELYFGLVPNGDASVEFRTKINQWDIDRTKTTGISPLLFSPTNDSIVGGGFEEDFTQEKNAVTALGRGEGNVKKSFASTAPGNIAETRKEITVNASNERDFSGVTARAAQGLTEHRARRIFTGTFQSVQGNRYGTDWRLGTRATGEFRGKTFDLQFRSVVIKVNGQAKETITPIAEIYE